MRVMRFYDLQGQVYCRPCKDEMLVNADPMIAVGNGASMEEVLDEVVHPRDFEALGPRPWAGNEAGDRYVQCDGCDGQWGPDA